MPFARSLPAALVLAAATLPLHALPFCALTAARADIPPPPPANVADGTQPGDELPPAAAQGLVAPGELDGSWRVVLDDGRDMPLVTLDIAHAAGEARAAGVFTALPGLCPAPADGACDWDGATGEITDVVLIDGGVTISFNPGAEIGDEQNLRLTPAADGTWRGTLVGKPPRRVVMVRPPE
ncbi:hypothetical protein [Zavarzinia compransoris]|uniref:Alkaline proteinase inhibitor/ Outer membrane lipoprotein Omp19 domain-containing protein n=1 Tax=Zavarzinia compransoris TaxID=1264899 RepID=A0A317E653_9PROT|nr:hypothetical protein [Zavarzinia compransoris]PWR21700.1 hypothetical protein DKG75_06795 [Zavarzinia compransoris]TDP45514.1 hypothetical protein DES42_105220 [Zavarzinia compransoris]